MTWVRLDDAMADDHDLVDAGPLAFAIAIWALSYSSRHLTDGRVLIGVLKGCPWVSRRSALDSACERLEVAGFWTRDDAGYSIVDPFQYLQKSNDVREKRAANAERQARWRERQQERRNGSSNGVTPTTRNAPPVPDPTPKGGGSGTLHQGAPDTALALMGSPPHRALEQRPAGTCTTCHHPVDERFAVYEDPAACAANDQLDDDDLDDRHDPYLTLVKPTPDEKPVEIACFDCIHGSLGHEIIELAAASSNGGAKLCSKCDHQLGPDEAGWRNAAGTYLCDSCHHLLEAGR